MCTYIGNLNLYNTRIINIFMNTASSSMKSQKR